ncbi:MAG: MFS transporter, partial [Planktomarina sp.]
MKTFHIKDAAHLPLWRRPISLLFLMAAAMPIAFSVWSALLNNFVIEVADFDGADIGLLHTIREIPGFLAIGVIYVIIFMREQTLGWISLLLLGVATAITAQFPEMTGILTVTLLSSIGFHYYETVNQSLQLQWIDKARAPRMLGLMMGCASAVTLVAYVIIDQTWGVLGLSFTIVYWIAGMTTAAIAVFCWLAYPKFEGHTVQRREMVLRKRYWLYYALQF